MVLIYWETLSNADATRRLYVGRYMKRFPGRQVPCPRTFVILSCLVDQERKVSCRRLALGIDISSFTIWRTLPEHPYHLQHLKSEDPPRRIAFCQWLLQ
jgi:hypothetical protein